MTLLNSLFEAEKQKNYCMYIEIADKILNLPDDYSPALLSITRRRRNYYLQKEQSRACRSLSFQRIIDNIDSIGKKILIKTCPGIEKQFIFPVDKHSDSLSSTSTNNLSDAIIDASITKSKHLSITWPASYNEKQRVSFFQVQLNNKFDTVILKDHSLKEDKLKKSRLVQLDNEFMPILVVYTDNISSNVVHVKCIPFPSALRGGYHYAELVSTYGELSGIDAINAFTNYINKQSFKNKIQYIYMQSQSSNVGIGYCNEQFREWLTTVHNIILIDKNQSNINDAVLCLPQKTYPTISNIINGVESSVTLNNASIANILIVDESNYTPLFNLSAAFAPSKTEAFANELFAYPVFLDSSISSSKDRIPSHIPSCILQSNNHSSSALHPSHQPLRFSSSNYSTQDSIDKNISIVVKACSKTLITEEFLLAIANQKYINISTLVFIVDDSSASGTRSLFNDISNKWNIELEAQYVSSLNQIMPLVKNSYGILFLDVHILIHNPYTLITLYDNLFSHSAFSSGCMLNHLQLVKQKAIYNNTTTGMQLSLNQFAQTGRIFIESKNVATSLIPTDINVISNNFDLCMYNAEALFLHLQEYTHLHDFATPLTLMSCKQSLLGNYNICTTKLSASYIKSPTPNSCIMADHDLSKQIFDKFHEVNATTTNIVKLLP